MQKVTSTRFFWLALRASTALVFAIAPYHLALDTAAKVGPAAAYAKGGDGGGGEGHGGGSGSGGSSGSSGGSGPSGNSGPGGGDHGGNSGRNGADDGAGDDHGADNGDHHHGQEHVNPATGDKVEMAGNNIEVTHPDGTREEIENGRFEQKDATGRTIVERPATPADLARLQGL